MWEIGGNMWVTMIFYGISAYMYAPLRDDTAVSGSTESRLPEAYPPPSKVIGQDLPQAASELPATQLGVPSCPAGFPSEKLQVGGDQSIPCAPEDIVLETIAKELESGLPSHACQAPLAFYERGLASLVRISKTPMLWGTLGGLILNFSGVPLYPLPGKAIAGFGTAFAPTLYLLLGINMRFDLSREHYLVVARLLGLRWFLNVVALIVCRWALPFDPSMRSIIGLCVISPMGSPFVMYTLQNGYPKDVATMVYNLAAVASVIAINLLLPVV
eukprot:gnl/TRDRNA2_/TRDRNA2_168280_c6_seq1.p1 gnl/TRDRNA2_/TRDRNA2_168280_c6~~gnl/TRDRNA2_/TRDRNA2_168280_c6_seq1.p1  ORF type:complete len:272 (+),score=32.32 gnl/TRDRNA2_/TRDRNA2_168280_c6_seq1:1-816(+)